MTSRSKFASKTAFEALAIEDDQPISEEDIAPESEPELEKPAPVKLTKTAAKKAAKAAKEARQRQRAEKAEASRPSTPAVQTEPSSSNGTANIPTAAPVSPPVTTFEEKEEVSTPTEIDPPAESLPAAEDLAQVLAPSPEALLPSNTTGRPKLQPEPEPIPKMPKEAIAPAPPPPQDAEKAKKRQSIITRTLWTFIMIGGFVGLLTMGHAYMILLVMLCQTLVYREVTALFSLTSASVSTAETEGARDPWSKTLNWYWFAVTNYFLYGESIIYYFKHVIFSDAMLLPFATNHRIISFTLYTIGFMGFVMSLKKGYLKQQFGLFCWAHMTLMLIVVSSHFIVNNILEGLIWFFVPASLVICNDVFAYIWGMTIGRTPLIKLSPKKTVEGFVGAFFSTIVFSLFWGTLFMRFNYMICPAQNLGVSAWDGMSCKPNPVFVWREWEVWAPVQNVLETSVGLSLKTIPWAPYHFHLFALACFASLVAPFGGFFASGFKRAFDIKDFGDSIPGHGGMTDRMDCQFLMGVFTYVFYSSLIRQNNVTVGGVLQTIVSGLTIEEQLELIADLKAYLEGQGVKIPL